jgi:hypothetical protein
VPGNGDLAIAVAHDDVLPLSNDPEADFPQRSHCVLLVNAATARRVALAKIARLAVLKNPTIFGTEFRCSRPQLIEKRALRSPGRRVVQFQFPASFAHQLRFDLRRRALVFELP